MRGLQHHAGRRRRLKKPVRLRLLRDVRTATFDAASFLRSGIDNPSCHDGCAGCCYAKVLVGEEVGPQLYLHLKATGQWTPELRARLEDAAAGMDVTSHADWLPLRRPCALLDERGFGRGRCRVYPVRPVSCASTFAVDATADDCAAPGGHALRHVVTQEPRVLEPVYRAQLRLQASMGVRTHDVVSLPAAVLFAAAAAEGAPAPAFKRLARQATGGRSYEEAFDTMEAG